MEELNNLHNKDMQDMMTTASKAGMFSIMLAGIRALLVKNEDIRTRLKVFIAGVLAGMCTGIACKATSMSNNFTTISIMIIAPFISSIWPLLEVAAIKMIKKKTQ